MKPEFETYEPGFGGELKCPACGFNCLHHEKVEIFERTEDAEIGLHVTVSGGEAETNTNLSGNPSPRRHGLLVYFSCEGCSAISTLSLIQHKGNTYMKFSFEEQQET